MLEPSPGLLKWLCDSCAKLPNLMRGLHLGRNPLYVTYESPYVYVDTEAHLDNALARSMSPVLRGAGSEGIITITSPKSLAARGMSMIGATGGEELRFADDTDLDAHVLTIDADDVVLSDFLLTSTLALGGLNTQIGIYFPVGASQDLQRGHRTRIHNVEMSNWFICMAKHGGLDSPVLYDVAMENCYWHSSAWGGYMTYGVSRFHMDHCRILLKLSGETHASGNAFYGAANLTDFLLENSTLGQCDLMGLELTNVVEALVIRPRLINIQTVDTESFGISLGRCVEGHAEHCGVKRAKGVGIELAGTAGIIAQGRIIDCEVEDVEDVSGGNPEVAAYTMTNCQDSVHRGNHATNIFSSTPSAAMGVYVYLSERTAIYNGVFKDAGAKMVHFHRGGGLNTSGRHLIQGCSFRHTTFLSGQKAIYVSDTNVAARNNTAWEKSGWSLGFEAACVAGAAVECDEAAPVVSGAFAGSNKIIAYT